MTGRGVGGWLGQSPVSPQKRLCETVEESKDVNWKAASSARFSSFPHPAHVTWVTWVTGPYKSKTESSFSKFVSTKETLQCP